MVNFETLEKRVMQGACGFSEGSLLSVNNRGKTQGQHSKRCIYKVCGSLKIKREHNYALVIIFYLFSNLFFGNRINGNLLTVLAHSFKPYNTVDKRKECVVLADTYVIAGLKLAAALSYKDITCKHELTVGTLHAQTLGVTVSAVVRRAGTFLMGE